MPLPAGSELFPAVVWGRAMWARDRRGGGSGSKKSSSISAETLFRSSAFSPDCNISWERKSSSLLYGQAPLHCPAPGPRTCSECRRGAAQLDNVAALARAVYPIFSVAVFNPLKIRLAIVDNEVYNGLIQGPFQGIVEKKVRALGADVLETCILEHEGGIA